MPGYLYRMTVDFVSEEELSEAQLKRLHRETNENVQVLVLDEQEVSVVQDEQQNLHTTHMPHFHKSTRRAPCEDCVTHATDQLFVAVPEDL